MCPAPQHSSSQTPLQQQIPKQLPASVPPQMQPQMQPSMQQMPSLPRMNKQPTTPFPKLKGRAGASPAMRSPMRPGQHGVAAPKPRLQAAAAAKALFTPSAPVPDQSKNNAMAAAAAAAAATATSSSPQHQHSDANPVTPQAEKQAQRVSPSTLVVSTKAGAASSHNNHGDRAQSPTPAARMHSSSKLVAAASDSSPAKGMWQAVPSKQPVSPRKSASTTKMRRRGPKVIPEMSSSLNQFQVDLKPKPSVSRLPKAKKSASMTSMTAMPRPTPMSMHHTATHQPVQHSMPPAMSRPASQSQAMADPSVMRQPQPVPAAAYPRMEPEFSLPRFDPSAWAHQISSPSTPESPVTPKGLRHRATMPNLAADISRPPISSMGMRQSVPPAPVFPSSFDTAEVANSAMDHTMDHTMVSYGRDVNYADLSQDLSFELIGDAPVGPMPPMPPHLATSVLNRPKPEPVRDDVEAPQAEGIPLDKVHPQGEPVQHVWASRPQPVRNSRRVSSRGKEATKPGRKSVGPQDDSFGSSSNAPPGLQEKLVEQQQELQRQHTQQVSDMQQLSQPVMEPANESVDDGFSNDFIQQFMNNGDWGTDIDMNTQWDLMDALETPL